MTTPDPDPAAVPGRRRPSSLTDLMGALTGRGRGASGSGEMASSSSSSLGVGGYLSSFLPSAFSSQQHHHSAASRLARHRAVLQSEIGRLNGKAQAAARALPALQDALAKDETQLLRTGGARHLGLFRHQASVRRALLELEQEQWARAAAVLVAREKEVARLLEDVAKKKEEENAPTEDLVLERPAELFEVDEGLKELRRRRQCLSKVAAQGDQDLKRWTVLKGGSSPGSDGDGGTFDSAVERRRKLVHLVEHVHPLYFGSDDEGALSSNSLSTQRRELLQLRMALEREFSFFMEDQRYREGRLLDRWLALVEAAACQSNGTPSPSTVAQQALEASLSLSSSTTTASTTTHGADVAVYAPRCIVAFTNYLVTKRLMEPYNLPPGMRPALVGLAQSLVFRKARRVVFGYVKGGDATVPALNQQWREKVVKARRLPPQAVGVSEAFVAAAPYPATTEALSDLTLCLTPLEMCDTLLAAIRCLHHEAGATPERPLSADVLFPLLVFALVQADLCDVFNCLFCLRNFAANDYVGEKAYYITTLEAAVMHIFFRLKDGGGSEKTEEEKEEEEEEEQTLEALCPTFSVGEQQRGLAYLDEWLAAEAAMEETMDILEADGWF